jgi:hypothetical protein
MSDETNDGLTRREALRKAVLFSAGMMAGGSLARQALAAPTTQFNGKGIDLLALGDFGTRGDARQVAVARQMAQFAGELDQPLTAVLALGDNFYKKMSVDRFDKHFEKMYDEKHLGCPFYAIAGNHDYGTAAYDYQPGRLQISFDYAKNNPDSRWKMPSKWYALELPDADNPLVKVILLDGNFWPGALTPQEKIAQRRWLKAELAKGTKAPWLWMVSHYPIFSQTDKSGRGDSAEHIREWGPLLKEHNVSLYFAGHDHNMQHLRVEDYPTSFLVSGAGGAGLYETIPSPRGFTDFADLGFNHMHVTPERFQVQFINAAGKCLHSFERTLDGKVEVKAAA